MQIIKTILSILFIALILTLLLLILQVMQAYAWTDEQIVNAVYKAEGAEKADYLYGIRSVKYDTPDEARRICFNSIRNGRKRWVDAGKPYDLIVFISLRYCPPKAHPLNSNWVKNVNYFLGEEK